MNKWLDENRPNEPILQQIFANFNRGTLSKQINTTNPFRRGLVPANVEAPLIDDAHIERVFVSRCESARIYNGLILHAITYLIPDLQNYHKMRQQLIEDINASKFMTLFDLPLSIDRPFESGRRELAAAFCQCLRKYFHRLREIVNA